MRSRWLNRIVCAAPLSGASWGSSSCVVLYFTPLCCGLVSCSHTAMRCANKKPISHLFVSKLAPYIPHSPLISAQRDRGQLVALLCLRLWRQVGSLGIRHRGQALQRNIPTLLAAPTCDKHCRVLSTLQQCHILHVAPAIVAPIARNYPQSLVLMTFVLTNPLGTLLAILLPL